MNRFLTACAGFMAMMAIARGSDLPERWFVPGGDEGGLVILTTPPPGAGQVGVSDQIGELLDLIPAHRPGGLLVRQYRLRPGEYTLHVFDKTLHAPVTAGQLTYVSPREESEYGWSETPPSAAIESFFATLSATDREKFLTPGHIEPAGKTLYFKATPPGVRPPPNG